MTLSERDESVVRLLNDLEALRRSLRLYPPSHPSLEPARERLRERMLALGAPGDVLTASFGPGRLFWDGEEIALPPIGPAARLIPLLFHLGLAAVRFVLPDAADGLVQLATKLSSLSDPPGEADRAKLLDEGSAFPGIELVPIDLSGVQLLDGKDHPEETGSRPVWAELAQRLSRDGAFSLTRQINQGELRPGGVLELLTASGDPETLFDHLFKQLAEIVRQSSDARRPVVVSQVREFYAELLRLLDPERRSLAIITSFRHLPVASPNDPWFSSELLLDAVEHMLMDDLPIPDSVQRALHGLAAPAAQQFAGMPEDLAVRARHLLARLPSNAPTIPVLQVEERAPSPDLTEAPWVKELTESLTDEQVRLHLVRILQETITLWPSDDVAERAAVRLAEELISALDAGDIDAAVRLAPILAATRSDEARAVSNTGGVEAALRAFRTLDKAQHGDLTAILVALGEGALPAVLAALDDEESLVVRKRLLEVVARQGHSAFRHLRQRLDDPRWFVVRNAVFLLRRIGHPDALPLLKARLASAHPRVLLEILKTLISLQDPSWFRLLEQTMDSDDEERRHIAIEVASRVRNPDVVRLLLKRLRGRIGRKLREPTSLELIRALGSLRDPDAFDTLQTIVELKRWWSPFSTGPARREAATAIGQLEGPAAHRLAIALAAGPDKDLAEAARSGMRARPEPPEEEDE